MDIENLDLLPIPEYHRIHDRHLRELMELRKLVKQLFTSESIKEFIETQKQLKTIVLGEENL